MRPPTRGKGWFGRKPSQPSLPSAPPSGSAGGLIPEPSQPSRPSRGGMPPNMGQQPSPDGSLGIPVGGSRRPAPREITPIVPWRESMEAVRAQALRDSGGTGNGDVVQNSE